VRILAIFSDISYPPREGLHQQSVLWIKELQRHIEVDVFVFCRRANNLDLTRLDEDHITLIEEPMYDRLPSVVRGLICRFPNWVQPRNIRRLLRLISSNKYEVVYLEGAAAAGLARSRSADKTIINIVDPPSRRQLKLFRIRRDLFQRLKHLVAFCLAKILETHVRYSSIQWNAVSRIDAEYLRRKYPGRNVGSISVMVPRDVVELEASPQRLLGRVNVVVFADLRQPHMRQAFDQMLANLRQQDISWDKIEMCVLGRIDFDVSLERSLDGLPTTYLSYVADYVKLLSSADLIVLPDTVGTGIKNRAIQCMALGRAVLGTSVAMEGINVVNLKDACIVEDFDQLARAFKRLIEEPQLRSKLGLAAKGVVTREYHPDHVTRMWLEEFRKVESRRYSFDE